MPPSGSATPAVSDGTGDRPRTSSSSRTTGPVWTTRTGQRRCRDVPPKVLIFVRLPGQRRREARTLQTSRVTRGRLSQDLPRKDQFGFMSGANVNQMIFRGRKGTRAHSDKPWTLKPRSGNSKSLNMKSGQNDTRLRLKSMMMMFQEGMRRSCTNCICRQKSQT